MTGSPRLGNRANWSCSSYLTICQLRSFKRSKKSVCFIRIRRIARSWHPSRVSAFPVKRDAYSRREIFSTREKLEKLIRINHKSVKVPCDDTTNNAVWCMYIRLTAKQQKSWLTSWLNSCLTSRKSTLTIRAYKNELCYMCSVLGSTHGLKN